MKIYIAVYSHPHGEDLRAFSTKAEVDEWRAEIAKEFWETGIPSTIEKPTDPQEMVDTYWEMVNDEWFASSEQELSVGD